MTLLMPASGMNLQGGSPTGVLGVAQAGSNPLQGNSTIAPAATSPSSPKSTYINNQVSSQMQNLSGQFANVGGTIYNKSTGQGYSNPTDFATAAGINPNNINWNSLQFDTTWRPQATPVQSPQTQNPAPTAAPTGMNGYSGGVGSTQGVYDPYQSPAFQQYVNTAVQASQAGMSNPDIQSGLVQANTDLLGLQQISSNNIQSDLANPNLSQGALTGQTAAEAAVLANRSIPIQTRINLLQQQQGQAQTAANIPLTAGTTEAGYLSGLAKPTAVGTGQNLVLPNPATGTATTLASQPSYGLGTGIAGQPITYNQNTGAINSGGTQGLGSTPPALGQMQNGEASAIQTVGQAYGLTDSASQLALKTAIDNTLASNGDVNAAGVPANLQPAVKAALNQMSGGTYSPQQATIQSGITTQQQTQVANYTSASQQASNLTSILNPLLTSGKVNPNQLQVLNGLVQGVGKNTSNSDYQEFSNLVNDIAARYAQVLTPSGGAVTDYQSKIAHSLIDPLASGESISQVLSTLDAQAQAVIKGVSTPPNNQGLQMPSSGGLQMPAAGSLKL